MSARRARRAALKATKPGHPITAERIAAIEEERGQPANHYEVAIYAEATGIPWQDFWLSSEEFARKHSSGEGEQRE